MSRLPTGTVTFLLTDIEGSTRLWTERPEAMKAAVERHDALLTQGVTDHNGIVVKHRNEGDAIFAVFDRATDALTASLEMQRALDREEWPTHEPLRVRMAIHTGEADLRDGDYFGPAINRCARLRSIAHGGQVLLTLATEQVVRDALPTGSSLMDLGQHGLRDLTRPEHVFQLAHEELLSGFPQLKSQGSYPNNLPLNLTSFVGREREMSAVKAALRGTRLLTLSGMGGCGKTRLAQQVAVDLLEEYPDGVWMVELAAQTDPALVPAAVAAALMVREEPHRPLLSTLSEYLAHKQLLLVLDNCEHLVAACAQFSQSLLQNCAGVQILATSREALGVPGEATYTVPSLSLPQPGLRAALPSIQQLTQFEAVRLFIDRATAANPAFGVTNENAPAVAQICHRLDGIPLALELAAARVRVLSVEQIAARLDDRFRLLTGGSRTALPRQQTLRALIDWSYDLLGPEERLLLQRLSVFTGGWTLDAAEAVCADPEPPASGPMLDSFEVLDLMAQLVDKSLVLTVADPARDATDVPRYRMLETVRQYAKDRLTESGEACALRDRHRDYFVALSRQAEPALRGASQLSWLARLEDEHENLRSALDWCAGEGSRGAEQRLELSSNLWWFWYLRGYLSEAVERIEAALVGAPDADPHLRLRALWRAGIDSSKFGDSRRSENHCQEAYNLASRLGDSEGLTASLCGLGIRVFWSGDPEQGLRLVEESVQIGRRGKETWHLAVSLLMLAQLYNIRNRRTEALPLTEEASAIFRRLGDRWGVAMCLLHSGFSLHVLDDVEENAAQRHWDESHKLFEELGDRVGAAGSWFGQGFQARTRGELDKAREAFERCLSIYRELGIRTMEAISLNNLGYLAWLEGDLDRALPYVQASVQIRRDLDDPSGLAFSLMMRSRVLLDRGLAADLPAVRAGLEESFRLFAQNPTDDGMPECLDTWADYRIQTGDPLSAACLQGVADGSRERLDVPLPSSDASHHASRVMRLQEALGAEHYTAAWERGRALTPEAVLAEVLG